jgi:hypothetical protein
MVRLTQEERVIDGKKSVELNTLLDFMTNFLGDKNIKLPGIKELSTIFFVYYYVYIGILLESMIWKFINHLRLMGLMLNITIFLDTVIFYPLSPNRKFLRLEIGCLEMWGIFPMVACNIRIN